MIDRGESQSKVKTAKRKIELAFIISLGKHTLTPDSRPMENKHAIHASPAVVGSHDSSASDALMTTSLTEPLLSSPCRRPSRGIRKLFTSLLPIVLLAFIVNCHSTTGVGLDEGKRR